MRKIRLLSLVLAVALLAGTFGSVFAQGGDIPGVGLITGPDEAEAKALNGGGASFPRPLYDLWFATPESLYTKLTGVAVSYQPQGSGFGISNIQNETLDFGASDGFMTDQQLTDAQGGKVLHVPMALGGVVLIYNIPELTEPLKLTPENIAQIYFGDFAPAADQAWYTDFKPLIMWNDERLVANNPGLANVDKLITPVRRADSSGTTNIFTSYLASASPEWAAQVGPGANSIRWPQGLAGRQNPGVSAAVAQNEYSIGYVEVSYALAEKLPAAQVQNKAGQFVEATQASVSAAAAGVELPDDLRIKIVNGEGNATYPISGFTWLLIYENQKDAAKGRAIARLAWWAVTDGQVFITNSGAITDTADPNFVAGGYAPLPLPAIAKAQTLIASIKCGDAACLPEEIASTVK
jgi:phosphate transport system substrate-binding protein